MFDKFEWICARYEELSEAIVQPEIIADTAKYQSYLKERANLEPQAEAWRRYQALLNDLAQAQEMLADPDLAEMAREELDTLPVSVVRSLADEGQSLARQFSGPMGPPASLLDQTVITVEHDVSGTKVEIPMRMIFTCTSLGLIPGFSAPMDIPRHIRVSAAGRWVRLDAPFGTVYRTAGLGNVLVF